jgi:hypothetical protein
MKTFKCSTCDQEFQNLRNMQIHRKTHTQRLKHKCRCGKIYARPNLYRKHYIRDHEDLPMIPNPEIIVIPGDPISPNETVSQISWDTELRMEVEVNTIDTMDTVQPYPGPSTSEVPCIIELPSTSKEVSIDDLLDIEPISPLISDEEYEEALDQLKKASTPQLANWLDDILTEDSHVITRSDISELYTQIEQNTKEDNALPNTTNLILTDQEVQTDDTALGTNPHTNIKKLSIPGIYQIDVPPCHPSLGRSGAHHEDIPPWEITLSRSNIQLMNILPGTPTRPVCTVKPIVQTPPVNEHNPRIIDITQPIVMDVYEYIIISDDEEESN